MNGSLKTWPALLMAKLPTALVLLTLAAIGYSGYRTGWKWPKLAVLRGAPGAGDTGDDAGDDDAPSPIKVIPPAQAVKSADAYAFDQATLRFQSAGDVEKLGLQVVKAKQRPLADAVSAPGEIDYDQTRVSRLSVPVLGRAWRVDREVGDRVKTGDVLALVESPKVGEAKAEFLQSLVQMSLKMTALKNLQAAGGAVAERQLQEAQAERQAARARLFNAAQALINLGLTIDLDELNRLPEEQMARRVQFLGLPESVTRTLDPAKTTANLIPLVSPMDGVVAERGVVPGELVDTSKPLFVVADLSRVWVLIDVDLEDADRVVKGQPVTFRPDGYAGEEVRGTISWMSTTADEKTRTLPVRAAVDNPKEHFRAHTFGTARITVRDQPDALVVPNEAVQRDGHSYFVFVRVNDTDFQVRQIQYGVRSTRYTEVRAGVRPGEEVVTKASHALKSELLRGQIGDND